MKISGKQLETALGRLIYMCKAYNAGEVDIQVDLSMTKEDPGNGIMVDCLTLVGTKIVSKEDEEEERHTVITMEIYPSSEGVEPRAVRTETFKVKKKY